MTIQIEIQINCNKCSSELQAIERRTHWDIEPCEFCMKEAAEDAVDKYKEEHGE